MEPKGKLKFKELLGYMKTKTPNRPESHNKVKIILRYYPSSNNKTIEYLIEIMKKMNFNEEEIIYELDYDIFYYKFFELALNVFKDKATKIKFVVSNDDLINLKEEKKNLISLYLHFSILKQKSLKTFFYFLNYSNCEFDIFSMFQSFDFTQNYKENFNSLLIIYKKEKQNKKEVFDDIIELEIKGFESWSEKYLKETEKLEVVQNNNNGKSIQNPKLIIEKNNNGKNNNNNEENNNLNLNDRYSNSNKKKTSSIISITDTFNDINNLKKSDDKNTSSAKKSDNDKTNLKHEEENKIIELTKINPALQETKKDSPKQSQKLNIISIKKVEKQKEKNLLKTSESKNDNSNDNKPKNDIISDNIINSLKKNLFRQTVGSYFTSQKLKYKQINENLSDFYTKLSFVDIQNFIYYPDISKFIHINNAFYKINNMLSNIKNYIEPGYGFIFMDNKISFYATYDDKQKNEIIFNSKFLKQMDYDYAAQKESSYKTYSQVNDNDKIDYFLVKGLDFEKNIEFFFDSYFSLENLPNIFFPVRYPYIFSNFETCDKLTFKQYIDETPIPFIETDIARINRSNIDICPNFVYKPFIEECPIIVYQNEKNEWISEITKINQFKVNANSIVLIDINNSIPEKITDIPDDTIINKKEVQRALYFVIYKLIKKIDFYLPYVKYELLNNNENINNFKFQLFLSYNNKPTYNMNKYIDECLKNLIKAGRIKHNFSFQIIYLAPSISSLNIHNLSNSIDKQGGELKEQKKIIDEQGGEIQEQKEKIKKLEDTISELRVEIKRLQTDFKSQKQNEKLSKTNQVDNKQ